jgi:hypothetical protein
LFQTPGINATLVVFDCTSSGPNPTYRKEYLDGKNNRIPVSVISLSSNQRRNGRRRKKRHSRSDRALPDHHPVINAAAATTTTTTTTVEIVVPDMGLVPRGVNTIDLSMKEIKNIEHCQDDFMSSSNKRPILFSFVGNFRHPTRQHLLKLHNGIDQIIYNPYANSNKGSNNNNNNNSNNTNKVNEPYAIQENDAYVVLDYYDENDDQGNTAAAAGSSSSRSSSSSSSSNSLLDTFSSFLRRRVISSNSDNNNEEEGETDQSEYMKYSYTELLKKSKFGLVPRGM